MLKVDGKSDGRVVNCVIIPDYNKAYEIELERLKLLAMYTAVQAHKPNLQFAMKKKYREEESFIKEKAKLESEIEEELQKDPGPSNLAFIQLDSPDSVDLIKTLAVYFVLIADRETNLERMITRLT